MTPKMIQALAMQIVEEIDKMTVEQLCEADIPVRMVELSIIRYARKNLIQRKSLDGIIR